MSNISLVLGGIRSGKSVYAEQLVDSIAAGKPVYYLATGTVTDDDMAQRVLRHRERRPPHWLTIESPLNPTGALREAVAHQSTAGDAAVPTVLLLDSLDGWVSNLLLEYENIPEIELEARTVGAARQFVTVVRDTGMDAVIVSSEVGHSLVATSSLGRQFQDLQGSVNQAMAAAVDSVTLVVAGIPITIKPSRTVM